MKRSELLTKKDLSIQDWDLLTMDLSRQVASLFRDFSLPRLGDVKVMSWDIPEGSLSTLEMMSNRGKLYIHDDEIGLCTQGLFGKLDFSSTSAGARGSEKTGYQFGFSRNQQWLLITTTYTETPENTVHQYLPLSVKVHTVTLSDLLIKDVKQSHCMTIWNNFGKVLKDWHEREQARIRKVQKIYNNFENDNRCLDWLI